MAATLSLLRVLQYASHVIVVAVGTLVSTLSAFFVPPSKRSVLNQRQRKDSRWLALAISGSYLVEGIIFSFQAKVHGSEFNEKDGVFYVALGFPLWLVIHLVLSDAATVYWSPNYATWTLSAALEATLCFLYVTTDSTLQSSHFHYAHLDIRIVRTLLLALLSMIAIYHNVTVPQNDREREPLLQPGIKANQLGISNYIVLDGKNSEHDDDEDEEGGESQNSSQDELCQRLDKFGGWWAYLMEFRIFWPHIFPTRNPRLQLYMMASVWLMFCDRAANFLGPRVIGNLIDKVSELQGSGRVPTQEILLLILVIKIPHDQVLVPLRRFLSTKLHYWTYEQLLMSSFAHIMGLSLEFHENKRTGEVQASINQSRMLATLVDNIMENTIPLLLDIVVAFAYFTYLFDTYFTLILLYTFIGYGVVTYKGNAWATPRRSGYTRLSRRVQDIMNESTANWQTALYFNRQSYQYHRLWKVVQQETKGMLMYVVLGQVTNVLQGLVLTSGYGAVLFLSSYRITAGQSVGDMVTLLLYWGIINKPLFQIAYTYQDIANFMIDGGPMLEQHQMKSKVVDAGNAPDLVFNHGKVEYRNVSFSYNGKDRVIQGINFVAEPGSIVAVVGRTGSGKTTTCDKLLFRGYDVDEGGILIDNQDIRDVTQRSLRETLGIVRQEQAFDNDTVLNIMRFARTDATDEDIFDACKDAAIHDQIIGFPKGYHTIIGERGVKLSGGGKQRLAIAQLFLRNPKIVVLDEATSTVDNVTESEIQDAFSRICKGRTTFIIAHRLSTVQHADQILVMDRGCIIERGTHDKLIELGGTYYQLWNKKSREKKLEKELDDIRSSVEVVDALGPSKSPPIGLLDDSDISCNSVDDIMQINGQIGSRDSHKAVKRVTGKFCEKLHKGTSSQCTDPESENAPMDIISPRPAETTLPCPLPRRSSSIKRLYNKISAATSSSVEPISYNKHPPQNCLAFRPAGMQSAIDVPAILFSSPERTKHEISTELRSSTRGSPNRKPSASHSITRRENADESSSDGSHKGASKKHQREHSDKR